MRTRIDYSEMGPLKASLDALPGEVARLALGKGTLAAARVIRDEVRKNPQTPERTGALKRSIVAKSAPARVMTREGPRKIAGGAALVRTDIFYGWFLEAGVTRQKRGNIQARRFIEGTFETTKRKQLEAFAIATAKEIGKIVDKIRRGKAGRKLERTALL